MTRKFIIIFFILTLYGCGFNPIYNVSNDIKYKILVNEMTGDQFINNIIRDEIFKSSNKNSKEILKINFNTVYEKIILSNDTKGSPSEFQVKAKTTFEIIYNNKIIINDFNEKQILKNTSDFFGQKNYEENIKQNFANSIARKFNLRLLTIK
jgi:hypothetical protein|tara:strand:+ start:652 stop:1107 length:456 start_codon:yes stop_codon:yes gene_type:complete